MPILNDPTTPNPQYIDCKEPHNIASRGLAHELTLVSASKTQPGGDFIAADKKVLDLTAEVWHGAPKIP